MAGRRPRVEQPARHRRPKPRNPVTVLALALLVFAWLASELAWNGHMVAVVDPALTHWLAVRRSASLTAALVALTQLHSTVGIEAMLACVALHAGVVRKRWAAAIWLVAAVASSMLVNVGLKALFARHRPDADAPLVHLGTFSFPSGHALGATVFWACIWLLLPPGTPRKAAESFSHPSSHWFACRGSTLAPTSSPTCWPV